MDGWNDQYLVTIISEKGDCLDDCCFCGCLLAVAVIDADLDIDEQDGGEEEEALVLTDETDEPEW